MSHGVDIPVSLQVFAYIGDPSIGCGVDVRLSVSGAVHIETLFSVLLFICQLSVITQQSFMADSGQTFVNLRS